MRVKALEERDQKKRENIVAIKIILILCLVDLYEKLPPQTISSFISVPLICDWLSSNFILAVV